MTCLPSGEKYPSPARTNPVVTWRMFVRYFDSATCQSAAGGCPGARVRASTNGVIAGPRGGCEPGAGLGIILEPTPDPGHRREPTMPPDRTPEPCRLCDRP